MRQGGETGRRETLACNRIFQGAEYPWCPPPPPSLQELSPSCFWKYSEFLWGTVVNTLRHLQPSLLLPQVCSFPGGIGPAIVLNLILLRALSCVSGGRQERQANVAEGRRQGDSSGPEKYLRGRGQVPQEARHGLYRPAAGTRQAELPWKLTRHAGATTCPRTSDDHPSPLAPPVSLYFARCSPSVP